MRAHNFDNKIGRVFGYLRVVEFGGVKKYLDKRGHKKAKSTWICLCKCGNFTKKLAGDLKTGQTLSCGCRAKEATAKFNREAKTTTVYHAFSDVFRQYKYGARKRKLSFLISEKEFFKISQQNCFYCNVRPLQDKKPRKNLKLGKAGSYIYNGIDRLDNKVGYEHGNVVSCCTRCNRFKQAKNIEDFFEIIKKIYENRKLDTGLVKYPFY